MKLKGGERLVLKALNLQGGSTDYVDDARLAAATKMSVGDVRDWLVTLEGKGFVELTRLTDSFSAYVTAKGKQALRLTEPISSPKPAGHGAPVTAATPGGTGAAPPQPAATQKTAPLIGIAPDQQSDKVFISYSHQDDPTFAKQVYDMIRKMELCPWMDEVDMPHRGLPLPREVRVAIEQAYHFVILLGPEAIKSEWVAAELQHAIDCDKIIIPIRRKPYGELAPDGFEAFSKISCVHVINYVTDNYFELETFKDILHKALFEKPPPPGLCLGFPGQPEYAIYRKRDIESLGRLVLPDLGVPTPLSNPRRVISIWGMPGAGKSGLANMFASEKMTRLRFSDGLFWCSIGQTPAKDLLFSFYKTIGINCGDEPYFYDTEISALVRLGETQRA